MFKIAICDDEEILIRELRECLDRYSEETGREFCYFEYHDGTVGLMFLTSISQYVWKGYEYGAVNYLLKPLKYGRLKIANDSGKYKVLYKNIRYAETYKRNVLLHFENQIQVIHKNMKEVAALLETQRQFCRCHASFAVNLSYVKGVEGLEVLLTTGERIPVSQPKRKAFMAKMTDFWGDIL